MLENIEGMVTRHEETTDKPGHDESGLPGSWPTEKGQKKFRATLAFLTCKD